MYNTNITLKTIITLLFVIVTPFIQNYYLFWLILFYLLLLCIVDRNMKSLVITFFIALILLFVYFTAKVRILTIGLTIIDLLVLYITSISKRDLWKLKYEFNYKSISKRKELFKDNFRKNIENKNKDKLTRYEYENIDANIVKKNESDLKDLYRYSRVRFYGYDTKTTSLFARWSIYDLFMFIVATVVLILIVIFW